MKKLILNVLTMIPLASVALAAESKLTNIENQNARKKAEGDHLNFARSTQERLANDLLVVEARKAIFSPMTVTTTIELAKKRVHENNPKLTSEEVDQEVLAAIRILEEARLITVDETMIVSSIPSQIQ